MKKIILIIMSVSFVAGMVANYIVSRYDVRWIISGSMMPVLKIGAICVIDKQNTHPKKGQIACYVRNYDQLLVTHRVHDIDKGDYYFKGDANKSYDGYVVQKQIYGTVVFHTNSVAKLIEKNVKWDTKTAIVKNKKYQA